MAPRLREKRLRRAFLSGAFGIVLFFLLGAGAVALLWREEIRITQVLVSDTNDIEPVAIAQYTRRALRGTRLLVLPKDSIITLPTRELSSALLASFPQIQEARISRAGLTAIEVRITERVPVALWCGVLPEAPERCLFLDETGFIFKDAPRDASGVVVYGVLQDEEGVLGNTLGTGSLREALRLYETLERGVMPLSHLVIRAPDEVDMYHPEGMRITYLSGTEERVAEIVPTILETVRAGAPVEYIDMRFGNRVYVKRKTQ